MTCPQTLLQTPLAGAFDQDDLQWVSRPLTIGPNKGQVVKEAYIPTDRVPDFLQGKRQLRMARSDLHCILKIDPAVLLQQESAYEAKPPFT